MPTGPYTNRTPAFKIVENKTRDEYFIRYTLEDGTKHTLSRFYKKRTKKEAYEMIQNDRYELLTEWNMRNKGKINKDSQTDITMEDLRKFFN